MKTYRMFTEDYVDSYSTYRTSTGPGMGQYVPVADLSASKKKKKKLKESPLKVKYNDAIDIVFDKVREVIKKDLENGKVDSLNKLAKTVRMRASDVDNQLGRKIVTINQEFIVDEQESKSTKE